MKRILFITVMFSALATLLSCEKSNDDGMIPETIANSTWSSVTDENNEHIELQFTSTDLATYIVWLTADTKQVKSQAKYTYTYNCPNVTLTPMSDKMPSFTGRVNNRGSNYNTLSLTSADGATTIVLTQHIDKSDMVWK